LEWAILQIARQTMRQRSHEIMSNRHERRKAMANRRKELVKSRTATLDQHFDDMLRRVRTEFERTGEIHPGFECVTNGESFYVPANWPDGTAKAAACSMLRDSFRRRGVNRYVFACEAWVGEAPGLRPADDPDRREWVQVIAVEYNGPRRHAFAEITRDGETATLGPWEVNSDVPQSWLFELLDEGHSDRAIKAEPPLVGKLSKADFQNVIDQDPEEAAEFLDSVGINTQLGDLIADQLQKGPNGDPMAIFVALESVLRSIVKDMGSPKGLGAFARFLRDHPDKFPMFSTVPDQVSSIQHVRNCKATLRRFSCEKREEGYTLSAVFGGFMNMYMRLGSQAVGAVNLADRVENWDPEHQAKLREVGLRSSFELDDGEGHLFIALSADRYPFGVMGRRNAAGDLFVSRIINLPQADFATAVESVKRFGAELILGSEAKELLCKMEQVTGVLPRIDRKEIWEVEEWGLDEWAEQTLAEIVFAKVMNIQYVPQNNNYGNVAGYRVRRAPNGLALVPSDNDDEIFVGVKVEKEMQGAYVLGWLRGSEGKIPRFYQKNCWLIPAEALHDMEELPGKERLRAMPPYQERSS
jgi:hypothetical protein